MSIWSWLYDKLARENPAYAMLGHKHSNYAFSDHEHGPSDHSHLDFAALGHEHPELVHQIEEHTHPEYSMQSHIHPQYEDGGGGVPWTGISEQIAWGVHGEWEKQDPQFPYPDQNNPVTAINDGKIVANIGRLGLTACFNLTVVWGANTAISEPGKGWEFRIPAHLLPNQFAYEHKIRNILTGHIYRPGSSGGRYLISAMWAQPGTDPKNMILAVYGMGMNGKLSRLSAEWPFMWTKGSYMALSTGPWELNE